MNWLWWKQHNWILIIIVKHIEHTTIGNKSKFARIDFKFRLIDFCITTARNDDPARGYPRSQVWTKHSRRVNGPFLYSAIITHRITEIHWLNIKFAVYFHKHEYFRERKFSNGSSMQWSGFRLIIINIININLSQISLRLFSEILNNKKNKAV